MNGTPNGSSNSQSPSPGGTELSEFWSDDFAPLQSAGKAVLKVLRKDEASPHGDLYRRILSTPSAPPSASTASSSYADAIPNHHYFADGKFAHSQSIPLPQFLQDQLSKAKMATLMGLFPQAQMAWMTIDHTIYLWSYNSGASAGEAAASENEFLYFQVPSRQPIVSAGLARPKPGTLKLACVSTSSTARVVPKTTVRFYLLPCLSPLVRQNIKMSKCNSPKGVFTQVVEWCLVVTTKEEAMLCALARKPHQGLTAVPTKFVIPSDWVSYLSVTSTDSGRVFLGGQDGNLYELDYDLLVDSQTKNGTANDAQSQLDTFYDGKTGICPAQLTDNSMQPQSLLTQGKRALDIVFNPSRQPPRKCRKLNHSQSAFSSLLPDIVTKMASAVFGDSTTTGGGPIIQMVVDEERQVLYTLSTRGWICVLDIAEKPKVTLSAVLNTPSTARLYLEAVSRGRMYAPSSNSAREGNLTFPGGGEAAQAGVGGMDGARRILKMAEQGKSNRRQSPSTSLLTPVAIEVVPMRESTRITLVAITAGGMRYYLSSLNPNTLGAGPVSQPFGTPRYRQSIKPHSRMTLCHIRAPPSLAENDVASSSHAPSQPSDQRVDAACYRLGVFFAAFNKTTSPNANGQLVSGNVLVAGGADSKARILHENKKENTVATVTYLTPGGICESVSYPLSPQSGSAPITAILPGGRVWDICAAASAQSKIFSLAMRSKTPTDTELGFGIAPAYVPPSKRVGLPKAKIDTNSNALIPTTVATQTMSSLAISVVTNLLLSRPARYGIEVQRSALKAPKSSALYRISNRSGAKGFSLSAADSKASAGTASTRSARLSPWLLTPDIVPLSPMALQYLERPSTTFLALNAGGLHELQSPSILQQLSSAILNAGANARTDPAVSKFFDSYGYAEGCGMCLFLAMKPSSSTDLKEFAMRAALSRAYRPSLVPSQSTEQQSSDDPWVPSGYSFTSSALYEGLTLAVARVFRPFWHKPAVVVTEGRVLKRGSKSSTTPAKVELLLEDDVLEEVRSPLNSMQRVMSRVFSKAIGNVPLSKNNAASTDQMDIDDDYHFLTRALEFQRKGLGHGNSTVMRASEADELAQHIEERNIHSLFRLVSRTSQLLSLLSHLRRAHFMPDLPEVDWGQLHGIPVSHLVQFREGQDRVETTLNSLVTSVSVTSLAPNVSADAKDLAKLLSEQCYFFFSPGARYAYFGFQSAQDALNTPLEQRSRRAALAHEAVESLKKASSHWCSPSLITGRLLQTQDFEDCDKISERAMQCDSPLAKACALLIELEDVASVVDICLLTSSNFGLSANREFDVVSWRDPVSDYPWEKGLYHKRHAASRPSPSTSSSTAIGTNVTALDAVVTCHALIFHHLTRLLNSNEKYQLGEKMVSVCAASHDVEFLHKFFSHLLKRNHTDVLLRISSPVLEKWLVKEKKDNLELLLRYYQVQEKNVEAGEVAWKHATKSELDLDLNERVEYLVYAVDAYSRAISRGQADQSEVQLKLRQGNERLSIARLQGRVLQTISSTKYELSSEDIRPLQFGLVGANDLLNDFAIPCDMYEYCLLLLHACKHQDVVHIHQFWKSMLCEEIFPCYTRNEQAYLSLRGLAEGSLLENPTIVLLDGNEKAVGVLFEDGNWMKAVEETVVRLGSEVYGSGENFAFPVEFVTSCLESK